MVNLYRLSDTPSKESPARADAPVQAVLEEIVDRTPLGGFIVQSGSVVFDGSLEGQLERMRRRLADG
jgi:F0F1-type ATP synthase delta subunit